MEVFCLFKKQTGFTCTNLMVSINHKLRSEGWAEWIWTCNHLFVYHMNATPAPGRLAYFFTLHFERLEHRFHVFHLLHFTIWEAAYIHRLYVFHLLFMLQSNGICSLLTSVTFNLPIPSKLHSKLTSRNNTTSDLKFFLLASPPPPPPLLVHSICAGVVCKEYNMII